MSFIGTVNSDIFFRNRIINGNFDIWQRGTSFSTASGVNEYSADRFRTEGNLANTAISQQTFTQGQTAVPGYPRYFCRIAFNGGNTNGYWAFQQRIESPHNLGGDGTYTLSFYIRATTGTIAAGAWNFGLNGVAAGPALTTTFQKVTSTSTISGASEATHQTAYLFYLPQNTSALSVDIAQVQLEVGSVATPFERRPFGHELALCQRYCERMLASGAGQIFSMGFASSGNEYRGSLNYLPKRVDPTITTSSASNFEVFRQAGGVATCTSVSPISSASYGKALFQATIGSGLSAGEGLLIRAVNTDASIIFDAEL